MKDYLVAPGDGVAELLRENAAAAMRIARIFAGSTSAAEDAVQEAGLRYFRRVSSRGEPDNPAGYYLSCVANEARRQRSRSVRDIDLSLTLRASVITASHPDPEHDVLAAQIWDEIQRLPERQRIALAMRFMLDLEISVIAAHLACKESSARSLISRGVASLRKKIP